VTKFSTAPRRRTKITNSSKKAQARMNAVPGAILKRLKEKHPNTSNFAANFNMPPSRNEGLNVFGRRFEQSKSKASWFWL
jgi:hypothetical protein